jgi:sulfur carrier protein
MNIVLNGEQRGLDDALTLGGLIERLELGGKRLAVEVNEEVVPRSLHGEYRLHDGDRVEIVHAIGGG